MARAPNTAGMFDIRTTAILQDVVFASNPCAPGASKTRNVYHLYGDPVVPDSFTDNSDVVNTRLKKFDNSKDWVSLFSSMVIVGTVLGIIQSFAALIPTMIEVYNIKTKSFADQLTVNECLLIGASSYALFIMVGPISSCIVGWMGPRLTCIFGLLLFFVGLVLNGLILHKAVVYVSHLILMSFGGSLAYTSAMSTAVDRFRRALPLALVLLSISAPIGTAFYYSLLYVILTYVPAYRYEWALFTLAVIALILIAATHLFPTKQKHSEPFGAEKPNQRNKQIKKCIENSARKSLKNSTRRNCIPERNSTDLEQQQNPNQRSCLCVVVIDISVLSDKSFLIFASITFFTMLSTFIPYLYLIIFADLMGVTPDPAILLIIWYCIASIMGRAFTIVGNDYTFLFNRCAFQLCLIGTGVLFIAFMFAGTYGWLVGWSVAVGFLQGAITTFVPRVTMQTVPRKWVSSSWAYIVLFSGLGLFTGVVLIVVTMFITHKFVHGFVTIGISQILAGLLAFLLPNEEEGENGAPPVSLFDRLTTNLSLLPSPPTEPSAYSRRYDEYSSYSSNRIDRNNNICSSSSYKNRKIRFNDTMLNSNRKIANAYLNTLNPCLGITPTYCNDCPICTKVGCIPGCCPDCVPGGLTSNLRMKPCSEALNCIEYPPGGRGNPLGFPHGIKGSEPSGASGSNATPESNTTGPADCKPKPNSTGKHKSNTKSNFSKPNSNQPTDGAAKPAPYAPSPSESVVKVKRVNVEIRHKTSKGNIPDEKCDLPKKTENQKPANQTPAKK